MQLTSLCWCLALSLTAFSSACTLLSQVHLSHVCCPIIELIALVFCLFLVVWNNETKDERSSTPCVSPIFVDLMEIQAHVVQTRVCSSSSKVCEIYACEQDKDLRQIWITCMQLYTPLSWRFIFSLPYSHSIHPKLARENGSMSVCAVVDEHHISIETLALFFINYLGKIGSIG